MSPIYKVELSRYKKRSYTRCNEETYEYTEHSFMIKIPIHISGEHANTQTSTQTCIEMPIHAHTIPVLCTVIYVHFTELHLKIPKGKTEKKKVGKSHVD